MADRFQEFTSPTTITAPTRPHATRRTPRRPNTLTLEQARAIRRWYARGVAGHGRLALARMYGVGQGIITLVLLGKILPEPLSEPGRDTDTAHD